MNYIPITINKPLYDNFCYIRDSYIKQASAEGKWLKITTPNGVGFCSPSWMMGGKKMTKVFKYANNPMILLGREIPLNHERTR